jgi:MATE family multidrug resistance protein
MISRSSELGALLRLAAPIVTVQLGLMGMGFVDTMMAGHVSVHVLASVTLGNLYLFNVSVFSVGTLMALDPLVAQALGAGDRESVRSAVQRGLVLAVVLTLATTLLMLPARSVLSAFRQPEEVIPDAATFLRYSIPGLLPFLTFVVLRQSLQAMHRVAPIVWTIVGANVLNVALNWIFLFGNLGSPPLGARGSAMATSIARWVMALGLIIIAWRDLRPVLSPVVPRLLDRAALRRMLGVGSAIGAQQALEVGAFGAIGFLMGTIGAREMAAHQVAIMLAAMTFMVPVGVGSAAAVRVGHAVGAGDLPRAHQAARAAYLCGVGFMVVTALLFLAIPRPLAALFTPDREVILVAAVLIPIAGIFQVFDGAQAVGAGVLRGLGDTRVPLLVMLGSYWLLGIPVSVLLAFGLDLRAAGLWWGFVLSLGAVAVVLLIRVRSLMRRGVTRLSDT